MLGGRIIIDIDNHEWNQQVIVCSEESTLSLTL